MAFVGLGVALLPTEEGDFGSSEARVRSDGSFSLTDISEGVYQLVVLGLSQNAYIKTVRWNEGDSASGLINVGPAFSTSLEVTLSSEGGQVEGEVMNKDSLRA